MPAGCIQIAPHVEAVEEHIASLRARISELTAELSKLRSGRDSPYFTRQEAAAYYRCHPAKIDRLLAAGRLARFKFGRDVLIRKDELERLVAS